MRTSPQGIIGKAAALVGQRCEVILESPGVGGAPQTQTEEVQVGIDPNDGMLFVKTDSGDELPLISPAYRVVAISRVGAMEEEGPETHEDTATAGRLAAVEEVTRRVKDGATAACASLQSGLNQASAAQQATQGGLRDLHQATVRRTREVDDARVSDTRALLAELAAIKAKQADQERATQEAQAQAARAVAQATQAAQAAAHAHGPDPAFAQAPSSPMLPPAPRPVYYSAESAADAESVLDWAGLGCPTTPYFIDGGRLCAGVFARFVAGKNHLSGGEQLSWAYAALEEWVSTAEQLGGAWQALQPFVALGDRLLQELHVQHMFVVHGIRRAEVTAKLAQRSERTLEVIQAELLAARQKKTRTAGRGGGGRGGSGGGGNGGGGGRSSGNARAGAQ